MIIAKGDIKKSGADINTIIILMADEIEIVTKSINKMSDRPAKNGKTFKIDSVKESLGNESHNPI